MSVDSRPTLDVAALEQWLWSSWWSVLRLEPPVVFGAFIWAAKKDGDEDRATQRRLEIRRRTRLGR